MHLISGNTSGRDGGGIDAYSTDFELRNSSVVNNVAVGDGGGMDIGTNRESSVTITSSTISHNRADKDGGLFIGFKSLATIRHSTITGNQGGGLSTFGLDPILIENTIIARNPWRYGEGRDFTPIISGDITLRHSLIGQNWPSRLVEAPVGSPDSNGNLIGGREHGLIDPFISPLANNGGRVFIDGSKMLTHALLPGSPAIDAGDPSAEAGVGDVPEYDQRGEPFARVVDGDGSDGARIDMGALERQLNPLAGDYNFSGVVDAADFVVWQKTVSSTTDLRADGNGDGDINQDDHNVWRSNFGRVYVDEPATATTASTVDEGVLQGVVSIGTAGQVRHAGTSTSSGTGASETIADDGRQASGIVGTAGQIHRRGFSPSRGIRTAAPCVDLAWLARLRMAGGTADDETDDDFHTISGDERASDDGSRDLIELMFSDLRLFAE